MITTTFTARTTTETVHRVYEGDNGLGTIKAYTLCNGQVASRVRKTDSPATCKRCLRAA